MKLKKYVSIITLIYCFVINKIYMKRREDSEYRVVKTNSDSEMARCCIKTKKECLNDNI